jgi:hypothetical protein
MGCSFPPLAPMNSHHRLTRRRSRHCRCCLSRHRGRHRQSSSTSLVAPLCLLFGVIGCILAFVVVLGRHRHRLPLFSVFDRRVMVCWRSSPLVYMESPVRQFSSAGVHSKKARDGSVAPVAFILEVRRLIFKRWFRLPIATVLLRSDRHR